MFTSTLRHIFGMQSHRLSECKRFASVLSNIGVFWAKIAQLSHKLGLLSPTRCILDGSNEVLNINFGQRAEKYEKIELEVKKIYDLVRFDAELPTPG